MRVQIEFPKCPLCGETLDWDFDAYGSAWWICTSDKHPTAEVFELGSLTVKV